MDLWRGAPVLEPLEHSVLEIAPDSGPMEGAPVLEPLEHLVLKIALDGGLIKDSASDVRPKRVRTVLEPLDHSVPDVAPVWGDYSLIKRTVLDTLEHSGIGVTDNVHLLSGHVEVMSNLEPLEHSVLNTPLDGGLIKD